MLDIFEGEIEGWRIEGDVVGLFLFRKGYFVGRSQRVYRLAHVLLSYIYNASLCFEKIHQ